MMYVYRVNVSMGSNNVRVWINKDIIRYRVIRMGTEYMYLSPWPENYGATGEIRVKKSECFTELEEAKREAEERANTLIGRLVSAVNELKKDVNVLDKTQDINAE